MTQETQSLFAAIDQANTPGETKYQPPWTKRQRGWGKKHHIGNLINKMSVCVKRGLRNILKIHTNFLSKSTKWEGPNDSAKIGPRKNDYEQWKPKPSVTHAPSLFCIPQSLSTAQRALLLTASSRKPVLTASSGCLWTSYVLLRWPLPHQRWYLPSVLTRLSGPWELGPSDSSQYLQDLAQCLAAEWMFVELNRMIILHKPSCMFHQHWNLKVQSWALQPLPIH